MPFIRESMESSSVHPNLHISDGTARSLMYETDMLVMNFGAYFMHKSSNCAHKDHAVAVALVKVSLPKPSREGEVRDTNKCHVSINCKTGIHK
jgi:hypothetical protein